MVTPSNFEMAAAEMPMATLKEDAGRSGVDGEEAE